MLQKNQKVEKLNVVEKESEKLGGESNYSFFVDKSIHI